MAVQNNIPYFLQPTKKEEIVELDKRIDAFLEWYLDNRLKGKVTGLGEKQGVQLLRNLIEKMAVWYELRFPDYDVSTILLHGQDALLSAGEHIFSNNAYVRNVFGEDTLFQSIDWHHFYNFGAFLATLSPEEQSLFKVPCYRKEVYLDRDQKWLLSVNSEGIVEDISDIKIYDPVFIGGKEWIKPFFVGKHLSEVESIAKQQNIPLTDNNEIADTLEAYQKDAYFYQELLSAVMYRIIERGGVRMGGKRGLLFALEFNTNKDIPIRYGLDVTDPEIRSFINVYLMNGGAANLLCYTNYASRVTKREKLNIASLRDILKYIPHNAVEQYTPEEVSEQQKLVDYLNCILSQVADVSPDNSLQDIKLLRTKKDQEEKN